MWLTSLWANGVDRRLASIFAWVAYSVDSSWTPGFWEITPTTGEILIAAIKATGVGGCIRTAAFRKHLVDGVQSGAIQWVIVPTGEPDQWRLVA